MILHFSLLSNKIDSIFYLYSYLTRRVFNVIRLGPDDAYLRYQSFTGVAQRKRAGLITPRSGVRITSPVLSYFASVHHGT